MIFGNRKSCVVIVIVLNSVSYAMMIKFKLNSWAWREWKQIEIKAEHVQVNTERSPHWSGYNTEWLNDDQFHPSVVLGHSAYKIAQLLFSLNGLTFWLENPTSRQSSCSCSVTYLRISETAWVTGIRWIAASRRSCSVTTLKTTNAQNQQTLFNAIDGLPAAFAPPPHYSNNSNFRISPLAARKTRNFLQKNIFQFRISSGIFFLTFAAANCWQRYPCARYRINLSWRLMYPQSRKQQGI